MRRIARSVFALAALAMPLPLAGCQAIAGLLVLAQPAQIRRPELELTEGRLAIVVDNARPDQANPVFDLNLQKEIVRLFRENQVPSQVVSYDEVVRLRQANPDFPSWSIRKIGRALHADQVLCVRLENLQLRSSAGDQVITPKVELRLKVIGVRGPSAHARLWPGKDAEPDGRTVTHTRHPKETDRPELIDREFVKLARETAYYVARHFHAYDSEATPPREP